MEERLQRVEEKIDELGLKFDRLLVALEGTVEESSSKLVGKLRKEVKECRKDVTGKEPTADKEPAKQETGSKSVTEMPSDPRQWGMTVEQLYEFGIEVFGSPRAILEACADAMVAALDGTNMRMLGGPAGLTMYDVVTKFVKPKTSPSNLSLAVLMNTPEPKTAKVFISHSWAEKFCYFVTLLCFGCFPEDAWFQDGDPQIGVFHDFKEVFSMFTSVQVLPRECVVWICALAINQNADIGGELGADVMKSPFACVLSQSTKVIVVYNLSVDLYTRVWCVLEAYMAIRNQQTSSEFEVIAMGLPPQPSVTELLDFCGGKTSDMCCEWKELMFADELDKLRGAARPKVLEFVEACPMKVQDAQASVESDRTMIMEAIEDQAEEVNKIVNEMRTKMLLTSLPLLLDR